jgi:hypothetical protein
MKKQSNTETKPHSFCETPNENCTMNYCDENGCQNRKRELVDPTPEINSDSETMPGYGERWDEFAQEEIRKNARKYLDGIPKDKEETMEERKKRINDFRAGR